ncbi:putative ATP-dependent RNA helicase DHX34 [Clavelina lepadiformis]|uniref:putative ATP-dependent RNA helicase DHX34 n=1 Tax=Clavelina lepadiformis TaxID=159417 RepID=UPI004041E1B1
MDSFNWERHRTTLNKIFFRDKDFIKEGTKEYDDFWLFFKKFQVYEARRKSKESHSASSSNLSSSLNIPMQYHPRYRINISIVTKDIDEKVHSHRHHKEKKKRKRKHESYDDDFGCEDDELSSERISQFRSVILHYLDFCQKQDFVKLKKLKTEQANLPIAHYKDEIVKAVKENKVTIVAGDTGCGKSTQVPQYLIEAGFTHVACTQPRRIAAISLSKRVAYETLNQYGSEVAYQIRFEGTKTKATRILFLTEGLLLRQIQQDHTLKQYNVIILDEVHERHLQSDFLLGLLKILSSSGHREDLRLVLMSATINLELFSEYFQGSPVIQVPGRLYPIQVQYLPIPVEEQTGKTSRLDPRPYVRILQRIDKKYPSSERGDLLVFLPGMQEITTVEGASQAYAEETGRWIILPLHSTLSIEEQDKVFDMAPEGVRKCILSTNIAETSVTVDGVRFVADSGRVKEMSYDAQYKMKKLQEFWISRASSEQRKGRAGRTGPGVSYRLYSEDDYDALADYSTPEIQRVPLDSLILQMKSMGISDVRSFSFIEPPPEGAMNDALRVLTEHGAIDSDENITALGEMLAQLPVDVAIGKMLIMGSLFDFIEPVMSVASVLSVQSPYTRSAYNNPEACTRRRPIESDHGDPITLLNLFDEWIQMKSDSRSSSRKWCKRRCLEEQRFYEMANVKRQFQDLLKDNALLAAIDDKDIPETSYKRRQRHADKKRLRELKNEERFQSRKRKVLKRTDGKYEIDNSDDDNDNADNHPSTSITSNVKDLEFKIRHDLDKLYKASSVRRNFTLRDIIMLKIILVSGLYPQLAFPDDCNNYSPDSDQIFHTKNKLFVVLHPNGYFSHHPQELEPTGREDNSLKKEGQSGHRGLLGHRHQLLTYVSLLETTKPYLVNTMRVPALQTLLLFAQSLDTNADCRRIVADGWIEINLVDANAAQSIIASMLQLRNAWDQLLKLRLEATKNESHEGFTLVRKSKKLQHFLSKKLAEFLDSRLEYRLRRFTTLERQKLYVGPGVNDDDVVEGGFGISMTKAVPDAVKGGMKLADYLTYNCLQELEESSLSGDYLRQFWTCPVCQIKMPMTVGERLRHQAACGGSNAEETNQETAADSKTSTSLPQLQRSYHCDVCDEDFMFSAVEILKHKRTHKA